MFSVEVIGILNIIPCLERSATQICIKIVCIDCHTENEDLIHFSADFTMVIKDVIFLTCLSEKQNPNVCCEGALEYVIQYNA